MIIQLSKKDWTVDLRRKRHFGGQSEERFVVIKNGGLEKCGLEALKGREFIGLGKFFISQVSELII